MAQDDYAILVGISRYADENLPELNGPLKDVTLMEKWLLSKTGGGLDPANVTCIVTDEGSHELQPGQDMPPVFQHFLDAFMGIVGEPDKSDYIRRSEGRLYLYFSGHGFSEKYERTAHAALYVANSSRILAWNIYGTYFAQFAKDHALFDEIVLIMDCCRDAELTKTPFTPPLRKPTDIGMTGVARLLELYAAPRGGKAQERAIPSRGNEVHGLLTHAFLKALEHADPDSPDVTCQAIKGYLEENWEAICGKDPADPPEVIIPSNGEIRFKRSGPTDVEQRFKLNRLQNGSSFEIIDSDFDVVARVSINASEAGIERTGGGKSTFPIVDGIFVVPLPSTFCMAVAHTPEGILKRKFLAGGNDVEL